MAKRADTHFEVHALLLWGPWAPASCPVSARSVDSTIVVDLVDSTLFCRPSNSTVVPRSHSTIFHCLVNPGCHSAGKFNYKVNSKTLHWKGFNKLATSYFQWQSFLSQSEDHEEFEQMTTVVESRDGQRKCAHKWGDPQVIPKHPLFPPQLLRQRQLIQSWQSCIPVISWPTSKSKPLVVLVWQSFIAITLSSFRVVVA